MDKHYMPCYDEPYKIISNRRSDCVTALSFVAANFNCPYMISNCGFWRLLPKMA